MAAPEGTRRTPENDFSIMLKLERINQDENPIERERKLNQFYEELAELELVIYEQGEKLPEPGESPNPGA